MSYFPRPYYPRTNQSDNENNWSKFTWPAIGLFSVFATLFRSNSYLLDSVKLLILGSIVETGRVNHVSPRRRLAQWLLERFKLQYSITAQFDEGDPAYEWIIHFLTYQKVWRRSYNFRVFATNSKRKWSIGSSEINATTTTKGSAEYVPTYESPQLFRWNGYWLEIRRTKAQNTGLSPQFGVSNNGTIFVTLYTLDFSVLSVLVEEARQRYIEVSRPDVIVHMADAPHYTPTFTWTNVKRKVRRSLSSIILQEGVIDSLVQDAKEFIETEEWYHERGIPHRRGYLLHGPPGSGKSSTIYALAGELGLEIYSLSLASGFVDDSFLQQAASSIPKNSIFLIEDIDCAFPSREEIDDDAASFIPGFSAFSSSPFIHTPSRRSCVTLSGLLNVIDGVGSEEGKLFFATTNYIDRLDPALLRPGRIDKKLQYSLATKEQAASLFLQFYPESQSQNLVLEKSGECPDSDSDFNSNSFAEIIVRLSEQFASRVPLDEFSTAELQGYLLTCKKQPLQAVEGVINWVSDERTERRKRREREEAEREKARKKRDSLRMHSLPPQFPPSAPGLIGHQYMSDHDDSSSKAGLSPETYESNDTSNVSVTTADRRT
ncbi:P-loop containing nucleoside triphosphate hydrolase protein [Dendrothele bispora CBS 962.96]|uniref:P-loop containing nucleoside triphosphate hydrolase protein n=1 Tax=Dendrothele bispora (strain CBS 962.96) TaxID=1314807 RepID=A0A4S8M403_DENBC|nr:P-loop containing nucleoside triphosphate hydrolase protein [Dendrothele bispora CBS 962.96]